VIEARQIAANIAKLPELFNVRVKFCMFIQCVPWLVSMPRERFMEAECSTTRRFSMDENRLEVGERHLRQVLTLRART
jgi:hypothetical protein